MNMGTFILINITYPDNEVDYNMITYVHSHTQLHAYKEITTYKKKSVVIN